MKFLLLIFFILGMSAPSLAQVPHPAMAWIKGFGGPGTDQITSNVTVTNDGGTIIRIATNTGGGNLDTLCGGLSGGEVNIFVKYNADATVMEWVKHNYFRNDSGHVYIFPTRDGGFVFGGVYSLDVGRGFYITKYNAFDVPLWGKKYSKGSDASLRAMISTPDGGYILAATSHYTDSNALIHYGSWTTNDILVMKLDSNGNKVWSKVIGGSNEEDIFSIVNAPNNGCYVVGNTSSNDYDCSGNHGSTDVYVARFDSIGSLLWHQDFGGSASDGYMGWGINDGKGGLFIASGSSSSNGNVHHHIGSYDFWVLHVDSNGHIIWENSFGSPKTELPFSICKATDNTIWIAGLTGFSSAAIGQVDLGFGGNDAWIVHADSGGTFMSAQVLGSGDGDWAQMVHPLSDGGVIVGGIFSGNNGNLSSLSYYGGYDAFLTVFAPWTTKETEIKSAATIKLHPNPASEQLNIENFLGIELTYIICDMDGRTICNGQILPTSKVTQIDISQYHRGHYTLKIINNSSIEIHKIFIQ